MTEIYVCETAPFLRIKIRGKKRQFENKKLELTDEEDIKFMNNLLQTSTHVSALVKRLDVEAAEQIAREHREMMLKQNAASKGSVTSDLEKLRLQNIANDPTVNLNVDPNDPVAQDALNKIIRGDGNATELEAADLAKVQAEQEAKIAAEREAAEKAKEAAEAAKQSGAVENSDEKPKFSLNSLKKEN